jgi:hypothetical protein
LKLSDSMVVAQAPAIQVFDRRHRITREVPGGGDADVDAEPLGVEGAISALAFSIGSIAGVNGRQSA